MPKNLALADLPALKISLQNVVPTHLNVILLLIATLQRKASIHKILGLPEVFFLNVLTLLRKNGYCFLKSELRHLARPTTTAAIFSLSEEKRLLKN